MIKIIFTILVFAIFSQSWAVPNSLCSEFYKKEDNQNKSPLDPIVKDQLKTLLAHKYPVYYSKIRDLPCLDQELKKSEYLVDPLWNEIPDDPALIKF